MKILLCILILSLSFLKSDAQIASLSQDKKRLLLKLSSAFYKVAKEDEVSLDTSYLVTSRFYKLNLSSLITEGFENAYDPSIIRSLNMNDTEHLQKMLTTARDIGHLKLLVLLGADYAFQPAGEKRALSYLFLAKKESESSNENFWLDQSLILIGKCYFQLGDVPKARLFLEMAVQNYQKRGDNKTLAKAYAYYGTYYPFTPASPKIRIFNLEKAVDLYSKLNMPCEQITCQMYLAYLYFAVRDPVKSRNAALAALHLQNMIGFPYTHYTTELLGLIANVTKDNLNFLKYLLETVKSAETTNDHLGLSIFYSRVAVAYDRYDSERNLSVLWKEKAMHESVVSGSPFIDYASVTQFSANLYQNGKALAAVNLIKNFIKKNPPQTVYEQQMMTENLANAYSALNDNQEAEKYYLKALAFEGHKGEVAKRMSSSIYFALSEFYLKIKKYDKAKYFLNLDLDKSKINMYYSFAENTDRILFQIDSASGNYKLAYHDLHKLVDDHDFLYNSKEIKQLEDTKIKYETIQKEQSIRLLESQGKINRMILQKVALQRNITAGGVFILFLVSGLIFYGYKNKQRSNLALQLQQGEINKQNDNLQKLVVDKNHLLTEKDHLLIQKNLLLKEVHHRVKNNLQLVISLLESQSAFLNNIHARKAILESQNRVQAMSLIHQKLYSFDNVVDVDMKSYIPELVTYLSNSTKTNENKITFTYAIEAIKLDVAQAIPLGIILNEAVTNAIKYAFPSTKDGKISINMFRLNDEMISLEIIDNGVGLPQDFNFDKLNSLGMILMKGLTSQLEGRFQLNSKEGVTVKVDFDIYRISELDKIDDAV